MEETIRMIWYTMDADGWVDYLKGSMGPLSLRTKDEFRRLYASDSWEEHTPIQNSIMMYLVGDIIPPGSRIDVYTLIHMPYNIHPNLKKGRCLIDLNDTYSTNLISDLDYVRTIEHVFKYYDERSLESMYFTVYSNGVKNLSSFAAKLYEMKDKFAPDLLQALIKYYPWLETNHMLSPYQSKDTIRALNYMNETTKNNISINIESHVNTTSFHYQMPKQMTSDSFAEWWNGRWGSHVFVLQFDSVSNAIKTLDGDINDTFDSMTPLAVETFIRFLIFSNTTLQKEHHRELCLRFIQSERLMEVIGNSDESSIKLRKTILSHL